MSFRWHSKIFWMTRHQILRLLLALLMLRDGHPSLYYWLLPRHVKCHEAWTNPYMHQLYRAYLGPAAASIAMDIIRSYENFLGCANLDHVFRSPRV